VTLHRRDDGALGGGPSREDVRTHRIHPIGDLVEPIAVEVAVQIERHGRARTAEHLKFGVLEVL
jgi:hypothetical protein